MLIFSGAIYHFVLANLRWESHDNKNKQVYYLKNKFISYLYNFSCRDQESNLWCKHTYDLLGNSYINGGSLHYWPGIRRCLLKARTIWSVINLYLREIYMETISLIRYVKLLLISDRENHIILRRSCYMLVSEGELNHFREKLWGIR